ncbi:MAG TPA: disulfide bond formation protein B [Pseudorhizobium sp.]|nr:disulfide bond formation protein B [Pseudorhizobium sp.]
MAWIVALAATLGALFVGEIMRQTPCVLCWYQRIFMFPLALILGVAVLEGDRVARRYVLPLCVAGLLTAGHHVLVFLCPGSRSRCAMRQGSVMLGCRDDDLRWATAACSVLAGLRRHLSARNAGPEETF